MEFKKNKQRRRIRSAIAVPSHLSKALALPINALGSHRTQINDSPFKHAQNNGGLKGAQ